MDPAAYPKLDVTLSFDKTLGVDPIPLNGIPYDPTHAAYIVPVDPLLTSLFKTFGAKFGPDAKNPPKELTVAGAALKFNPVAAGTPLTGTISNALTIQWMPAAPPVTPKAPGKKGLPIPADSPMATGTVAVPSATAAQ